MRRLRVYSTADGESHFDEVEIPTSSGKFTPMPRRSKCRRIMRRHAEIFNCASSCGLHRLFGLQHGFRIAEA